MKKLIISLMVMLVAVSGVSAQVMEWRGVLSAEATSLDQNDVDDADNWYDGTETGVRRPNSSDNVFFRYSANATNQPTSINVRRDDLAIPVGSLFEAHSISLISRGYNHPLTMPLYLQKSLSLDNLYLEFGNTSGGQGELNLRIGSPDTEARLLLRQVDQDEITGGNVTITGIGGPGVLNLDGLAALDPEDLTATRTARRNEIRQRIIDLNLIDNMGVTATGTGDITIISVGAGSDQFVNITAGATTFRTTNAVSNHDQNVIYGLGFTESTLTLTGEDPVDFARDVEAAIRSKWRTILIYPGSKLLFTNPDVELIAAQLSTQGAGASGGVAGLGGTVEFGAEPVAREEEGPVLPATVTLADPGIRSDGAINVEQQQLVVRSDQQWLNPSGVSFIRMRAVGDQPLLVASDGLPLNNLGQVALVVERMEPNMFASLPGGTYQSMHILGGLTSGRTTTFDLAGDVLFAGAAVMPGNNTTVSSSLLSDYSLYFNTSQRITAVIRTQGYDLTTEKGVYLYQQSTYTDAATTNGARIEAQMHIDRIGPTTIAINGNLVQNVDNAHRLPDGTHPVRSIGILGDGLTNVVLNGNYVNYLRSLASDAMTLATLRMLGGTDVAPRTVEVMGHIDNSFGSGTSAIGELAVGDGVAPAYVQLVNETVTMAMRIGRTRFCWLATLPLPAAAR